MSADATVQDRVVNATRWAVAPAIAAGWSGKRVLITFPLSHFCEKARWALDHAGLSYRELGYAPAVHKYAVRVHGSQTAPLLVGARTLRQSTDILRFASGAGPRERRLYPDDRGHRREIEDVVAWLDLTLGPHARLWFYSWALADPRRLYDWGSRGLGPQQRLLLRILSARIAVLIAGIQNVTARSGDEARGRIDEDLGAVSAMLADGRRYLGGDSFSAADLTFAALAGPAVWPPGYGGRRLALPPVADELAPQTLAWRATPAGQLAMRLYREHRAAAAAPGAASPGGAGTRRRGRLVPD